MSILIVDDSSDTCNSTKCLLETAGYTDVRTALSAHQAFSILGSEGGGTNVPKIDTILMDVSMPEMGGIEACRRIKSNIHLRDIPIIIVTGRNEEDVLEEAFAAGAMDFITKPAKLVELLVRLRSALTLKHELDCRRAREHELSELTLHLEETNRILEHLARIDPVTGLASRRSFDTSLASEWHRTGREGVPMSLIMIDSDDFKAFNDTYGHPKGDECLRQIAHVLRDSAKRPGDLVARYGGEEFGVILPHTNLEGATAIARRILGSIEKLQIPHVGSSSGHVTVSCGVATIIPDPSQSPESLLMTADQALYQAKHNGKNQLCAISIGSCPHVSSVNGSDGQRGPMDKS